MAKAVVSGKSPYAQGHASRRGRGTMLIVTVVILLVAALAWTTVYTRAVATSPDAKALPANATVPDAAPDRQ